ncbi:HD domain-containing protein [Dethiobacter alkaliphilus]|uniref:HD domain-containing protein n=1 Tax=Dethiobacter alkaliphilus TaxID=427926 RepID=UPI0022266A53|nr:hypothetical protein [Dethiobacter alkaliphilus]MCW3490232.1 hypothetical protein [Dethiobacter alkaliphilus]
MTNSTIYGARDGLRHFLEQRENSPNANDFPEGHNSYSSVFQQIETFLNSNVHPLVGYGSVLNGEGFLTDHGQEHVAMVIQRAGLILGAKVEKLLGYEIFLLLLAIHFHDVGNIYGREKHEERIFEVMEKLGQRLPLDTPSKRLVAKIAMAHGGEYNGCKDTVSNLLESEYLQGIAIRTALLASILRFADEIADDHTRSSRFMHEQGIIPAMNKLYHDYSACLQPAAIEGSTLILKYDIPYNLAVRQSTKESSSSQNGLCHVYLYDEILNRLKKCLCELDYCQKYSQGFIGITSIRAEIEVHQPDKLNPVYKDKIMFRLSGYPSTYDCCIKEVVAPPHPQAINGNELKHIIEEEG